MGIFKHCIVALATLLVTTATAQIQDPVKWDISSQKLSDTEYQIDFKAQIDADWHIFAQYLPKGNYSLPTRFSFEQLTDVERVDTVRELSKVTEENDEYAGAVVLAIFLWGTLFTLPHMLASTELGVEAL